MSLLEAEFDDAESEYQHGRLETHLMKLPVSPRRIQTISKRREKKYT